jgi:hypothetical protein
METEHGPLAQSTHKEDRTASNPTPEKQPWQEPKLAFVEPKLTPHGKLEHMTGGFFGTFTP